MSLVEVDGAGWRWVHGLVIPIENCSCVDSLTYLVQRRTYLHATLGK